MSRSKRVLLRVDSDTRPHAEADVIEPILEDAYLLTTGDRPADEQVSVLHGSNV